MPPGGIGQSSLLSLALCSEPVTSTHINMHVHARTHAKDFRDFYREVPQLVLSADTTHSEGWEMASLGAAPELVVSLGIPGLRKIGS